MESTTTSLFQQSNVVYVGQYQQLPVQLGTLTLPYPLLERMIGERSKNLERTQRNNHIVALSVLKSAVVSFLQFERSFKSLLSKGDDNTQIAIIRYAIEELRTANQSFDTMMDKSDPVRVFITEPDYIVDVREIFEHCIKILLLVLHLLGGRDSVVKTNKHEYVAQAYGWTGWQQVSEQLALSNNVLTLLLRRFDTKDGDGDDHYKLVLGEVRLFSLSVSHVTECFMVSVYPNKARILQIYDAGGSDIRRYLTVTESSSSKETPTLVVKSASWF